MNRRNRDGTFEPLLAPEEKQVVPPGYEFSAEYGSMHAVEEAQRRRMEDMRSELIAQGHQAGWEPERVDAVLLKGGLRPYTSGYVVRSVLHVERMDTVRASSEQGAKDAVSARIEGEDVPGFVDIEAQYVALVPEDGSETPPESV